MATDNIVLMQKDTDLGYDKWYEIHGDELWIIYHEKGANYDTDYEAWCEARYEKCVKDQNALIEGLYEALR